MQWNFYNIDSRKEQIKYNITFLRLICFFFDETPIKFSIVILTNCVYSHEGCRIY